VRHNRCPFLLSWSVASAARHPLPAFSLAASHTLEDSLALCTVLMSCLWYQESGPRSCFKLQLLELSAAASDTLGDFRASFALLYSSLGRQDIDIRP